MVPAREAAFRLGGSRKVTLGCDRAFTIKIRATFAGAPGFSAQTNRRGCAAVVPRNHPGFATAFFDLYQC